MIVNPILPRWGCLIVKFLLHLHHVFVECCYLQAMIEEGTDLLKHLRKM